ncbi:DNA-binding transcriptional regulator, GntR family [Marivita hallyeonensis]|uniref:DNA-binding transcriptional regulator, GntR family n=2 Tax=Marivita hallyeonensis TaxID=996342 RepID=A0A1M5NXA2_9RHOB|nr:DNA-binding transcriptional regulator, GntR family [Marivita hallyeonensis]
MSITHKKTEFPQSTRADVLQNPVFVGIEQAILEQRIPPGMRLAENDLGDVYGVSRTIVRAGLQALSQAHLVTLRPNRGASVANPSPREAREVFEARELLEPRSAREAALNAKPKDIADLRLHALAEHEAMQENASGRALRLSGLFHVKIAEIANQKTIAEFIESLVSRSSLIIALYWTKSSTRCDEGCHNALIDAIERHDADEAEDLMRSHLVDIHSALSFGVADKEHKTLKDMLGIDLSN